MAPTLPSSTLRSPVALHSTATHGADLLFQLVDAALWLMVRRGTLAPNSRQQSVEIVLHPMSVATSVRGWAAALARRLRSSKPSSLQDRVFRFREQVVVETSIGTVSIRRSNPSPLRLLRLLLRCVAPLLRAWMGLLMNGRVCADRLLTLRHHEVLVGDLVASHALRTFPAAGGSLWHCGGIIRSLARSFYLCEYAESLATVCPQDCHVMVPEATYLHAVYQRVLHSRGANVIYLYDYETQFRLIRPDESLVGIDRVRHNQSTALTEEQRRRAESYLNARVTFPGKHLRYMNVGTNRAEASLCDDQGSALQLRADRLSVVVFLHSFDDAQYFHGFDGFSDIYEWTEFTLDTLLDTTTPIDVFLKAHPNVDYDAYPGDRRAFARLRSKYEGRVRWLASDTSPLALASNGRAVGITHHGSVAEELTYLGIPVVASEFAPWGTAYTFGQWWSDPEHYGRLLRGLAQNCGNGSTASEREELLRFVTEYRLSNPAEVQGTWEKFAIFCTGQRPRNTQESYRATIHDLANLKVEDPQLRPFLEMLIADWQHSADKG